MLKHRIRDLLFHYKKGVILIQFYLVNVLFKIMHHLSFRAGKNDVNSTKRQPNVLFFDWINEMTSDKRLQAIFSGFGSC